MHSHIIKPEVYLSFFTINRKSIKKISSHSHTFAYLLSNFSTIPFQKFLSLIQNSDVVDSSFAYNVREIFCVSFSRSKLNLCFYQFERKATAKSCWSWWVTPNRLPISPYCLPGAVRNFIKVSVTSKVISLNRDKLAIIARVFDSNFFR